MLLPSGTRSSIWENRTCKSQTEPLSPSRTAKKLKMFKNTGTEQDVKLTALAEPDVDAENAGAGSGHHNSSANPDSGQAEEDGFAAGIAEMLNSRVLSGNITGLIVIAAPRTLGELRKRYHKNLSSILVGEIPKDLTGHSIHDIEKAIASLN